MSSSNLPNLDYVYFRSPFFWLCLTPNSSYFKSLICQLTKFIMPISKGLIPNSILCLIPKVLLQCHVFRPFMPNSKGLPTPIPPPPHNLLRPFIRGNICNKVEHYCPTYVVQVVSSTVPLSILPSPTCVLMKRLKRPLILKWNGIVSNISTSVTDRSLSMYYKLN